MTTASDSTSATPAKPSEKRRDGWVNTVSGHGTARDRRTLTSYGVDIVTDVEAMQLWRSEFLAAHIIEKLPEEAYRRAFSLKIDGPKGKEQAERVMSVVESLGAVEKLTHAGRYERAYGGAALFPVLRGAVGALETELPDAGITEVAALHILEPRELTPVAWYTDLESTKFKKPSLYQVTPISSGRGGSMRREVIHESRLIIWPGIRVSEQTQPGQRLGWGDTCLCRPRQVMADFGLAWGSAATLLHEFAQGVLKMKGLADILAQTDGEALLARRMTAFSSVASSLRLKVIDSEDDYERKSTPITGMDGMLVQFAQLMAAAADMPLTVLLGMSPAGMNATGEFDQSGWYDRVSKKQTAYTPMVEQLLRLILRSTTGPTAGSEPESWSAEWLPLQEQSDAERAATRKVVAETDKIYFDMGAASADSIATSRWKGDTYSAEMQIDWAERAKQKQIEEEHAEQIAVDKEAMAALGRDQVDSEPVDEIDSEA